jgi:hypothetical protein
VEAALTARTMGELAVLTADLPTAVGGTVAEAKDIVRIEQQGASTRRGEGGWCHGGWRSARHGAR